MQVKTETPNVLLAEVGASNGADLRTCLSKFGWQLTCVSDEKEAIKEGTRSTYDLIVSDMQIPLNDCINWIRTLKNSNPQQAIIVVGGGQTLDDALQLFRAGATDVVFKPLNAAIFEQVAKRVIGTLQEEVAERRHERILTYEKRIYRGTTRDVCDLNFKLDILKRLRACGRIDAACVYQVSLAFQEALTNSIDHGNLELESEWKEQLSENGEDLYGLRRKQRIHEARYGERHITICVECDGTELTIEITDEGNGFDPAKRELEIRQDLNVHGRGIPIMHGVLDEVRYDKGGRQIRLVKRFV